MDLKTTGAWLVHHTAKLEQLTGIHSYDNVLVAGKAAILLSALSATEEGSLTKAKVEILARAANINVPFELPNLLQMLEARHLIRQGVNGIDVLGVTGVTVLERGAEIFNERNPSGIEQASIDLAERASVSPLERHDVAEYLSDSYRLAQAELKMLFAQAEDIGFVDYEEVDSTRRLYFNGNLFRRQASQKAVRVLDSLTAAEASRMREVDEKLRQQGCVTVHDVEQVLGEQLFQKLKAIGLYDISTVNNSLEDVAFVTRPAAFNKYGGLADDALDLAKALVSSLTYGMTRSGNARGRIRMIELLLDKLIRGQWVGSADAIGEDYRALELKNVIAVRQGADYGYDMQLLKKDVGEMALAVIRSGDASEMSLIRLPGATVAAYTGPEQNRTVVRKQQSTASRAQTRDMIMALRTGALT